jgi:hypothetical protein
MKSADSVGMADNNMGPSTTVVARTPQKVLSLIPKAVTSSKAPTPKRPQSLSPKVEKATKSRRPRAFEASEASDSENTVEI